jgi:hypothetical protein
MEKTKSLFHYTSQSGLLGILKSNKLWMTDILYLNDSSEFLQTLELVNSELLKHRDSINKKEKPEFDFIITFIKYLSDTKRTNNYVFSLSQNGNDISQWRGYCPSMGGFSIEFDPDKLITLVNINEGYKIGECIYKPIIKEKIITSIFSNSFDEINQSSSMMDDFMKFFLNDFSYFKHESFINEEEYRIVAFLNPKNINHREGKSMLVPYIEFSPLDNDKLPISKIIVGPTPHQELSILSVESLLISNGFKEVKVEASNIPYRSW